MQPDQGGSGQLRRVAQQHRDRLLTLVAHAINHDPAGAVTRRQLSLGEAVDQLLAAATVQMRPMAAAAILWCMCFSSFRMVRRGPPRVKGRSLSPSGRVEAPAFQAVPSGGPKGRSTAG